VVRAFRGGENHVEPAEPLQGRQSALPGYGLIQAAPVEVVIVGPDGDIPEVEPAGYPGSGLAGAPAAAAATAEKV